MSGKNLTDILSAMISLFGLAAVVLRFLINILSKVFSNVESLETTIVPK